MNNIKNAWLLLKSIEYRITQVKKYCYTSQLKYILRLEENASRAVG